MGRCWYGNYYKNNIKCTILASGSEVGLAIEVGHKFATRNIYSKVISVPCLDIFEKKPFDKKDHGKYLKHEKIENLVGLKIDLVYEWELGSMLIFDRTRLHCSSCLIEGKKIGLTTFTKK